MNLSVPSFSVSLDCVSDSLPCTADKSVHCDEFAGDTTNNFSSVAVVVCNEKHYIY
jgi:hypothetical protein